MSIKDVTLKDWQAIQNAASNVSRETFDSILRDVHGSIDDRYVSEKWSAWCRYGLDWLSTRSSEEERRLLYAEVLQIAESREKS